ncbi:MAG TPA: class I SAM-dependent methyltransferase [Flavobacterium sp.]|jgi:YD repeat-containing protein
MDFDVLKPQVQQFIINNTGADVSKLALTKNPFPELDWQIILGQISARGKAKEKLPSWFLKAGILYPSRISVEQTSSETTAKYKSGLVSGKSLIDLTGGFGVDAYYFSKKIGLVAHCEQDELLSRIAHHNSIILGAQNIQFFSGDGTETLRQIGKKWDWIYLDPSRRNDAKGKVFMLNDCLPNVPALLSEYFHHADHLLVKTAPILDISAGLSELRNVKEIHVLAVDNEVKELLWTIEYGYNGAAKITAVNITKGRTSILTIADESSAEAFLEVPLQYLYEPNAAIMKAGGFNTVSQWFTLAKLHAHSHLYTAEEIIPDFPGRIFRIENSFAYNKARMKQFLQGKKANITTRNFPEKVDEIRKKWKMAEGGNTYCFFTTDLNDDKIVLICTKILQ